MSVYDTLNDKQKEAVFHTEGPLLVLAGAGSGKTRVLTHRIAYLMEEKKVKPWNILAITFTNKAAGEMRERVDKLVGDAAGKVWVSTFHSACVRILRRDIGWIGFDTNFAIYDTEDQKSLMKSIRIVSAILWWMSIRIPIRHSLSWSAFWQQNTVISVWLVMMISRSINSAEQISRIFSDLKKHFRMRQ